MKRKHMLVRGFLANQDPLAMGQRPKEVRDLCERALGLRNPDGSNFVERIHFLWVNDERYDPKQRDCGIGEPLFRAAVADLDRVEFHKAKGGAFSGVLNYGAGVAREQGADIIWCCSPESYPVIDQRLADEITARLSRGARVIPVAVNAEVQDLFKQGVAANACTLYDLRMLQDSGGFIAIADPQRSDTTLTGKVSGMEEGWAVIYAILHYGRCVSVITPETFYSPPMDAQGAERHRQKIASKEDRIKHWCDLYGVPFEIFKSGLMEEYHAKDLTIEDLQDMPRSMRKAVLAKLNPRDRS